MALLGIKCSAEFAPHLTRVSAGRARVVCDLLYSFNHKPREAAEIACPMIAQHNTPNAHRPYKGYLSGYLSAEWH